MPRLALAPLAAALGLAVAVSAPALAEPRVVASVPPLHGLVSAVMQGAGTPHLLIPADASPHHYALRPSDARALAEADIVFTVGAGLEAGLGPSLSGLAGNARILELSRAPGLDPLPASAGHEHGEADHDEHDEAEEHAAEGRMHENRSDAERGAEAAIDPHLWLDPEVAALWLETIAGALLDVDPANAQLYRDNAAVAAAEIHALTDELEAMLAPVRGRDYAVFHDAYRYFERRFGLEPGASLASGEGDLPGARGIAGMRERLAAMDRPCLFAEPQHEAALVASLARDSGARAGTLDPIGQGIPPGPEFYPALLRGLARDFVDCLATDS